MLAKCANPACSTTFRYLHEGKLFAIEPKANSAKRGPPADPEYTGRVRILECFWLCSSCCCALRVQWDGDHGMSLLPKKGEIPPNASATEDSNLLFA
jgi:hypothetical protein